MWGVGLRFAFLFEDSCRHHARNCHSLHRVSYVCVFVSVCLCVCVCVGGSPGEPCRVAWPKGYWSLRRHALCDICCLLVRYVFVVAIVIVFMRLGVASSFHCFGLHRVLCLRFSRCGLMQQPWVSCAGVPRRSADACSFGSKLVRDICHIMFHSIGVLCQLISV